MKIVSQMIQVVPKCNPKCPFKKEVEGNLIRKDKMVI